MRQLDNKDILKDKERKWLRNRHAAQEVNNYA